MLPRGPRESPRPPKMAQKAPKRLPGGAQDGTGIVRTAVHTPLLPSRRPKIAPRPLQDRSKAGPAERKTTPKKAVPNPAAWYGLRFAHRGHPRPPKRPQDRPKARPNSPKRIQEAPQEAQLRPLARTIIEYLLETPIRDPPLQDHVGACFTHPCYASCWQLHPYSMPACNYF